MIEMTADGYKVRLGVTTEIMVETCSDNVFNAVFAASDASDALRKTLTGHHKWLSRDEERSKLLFEAEKMMK